MKRRKFLSNSIVAVSAFSVIPRHVLGGKEFIAPSDKLNIGCIGIGGKGRSDVDGVSSENIIALCDVDQDRAKFLPDRNRYDKNAYDAYPQARRYVDFREMLDCEKDLDAVTISTPDHTHAVITMEAMKRGIHVYTQKPLTRTIEESRRVIELARSSGVATQMGNQGHAREEPRTVCELIWQGTIGKVNRVHVWTDRPVWPQGVDKKPEGQPVPSTLNWDLWLGPVPFRPYNAVYVPFNWRGWWDFGCGALGDMGCHLLDYPFWALKLKAPKTIEAYSSPVFQETAPLASIVTYTFDSGLDESPVEVVWYDGGLKPTIPRGLKNLTEIWTQGSGAIYEGDEGILVQAQLPVPPVLLVKGEERSYSKPKEIIPRSPGHYKEWISEIKGSSQRAMSNFDYAGLLNESVLLGNVAIRSGKKLEWDYDNMRFPNVPEANQYLKADYRSGWG